MEQEYLLDLVYKGVFVLVLLHAGALAFWLYCIFTGEGEKPKVSKLQWNYLMNLMYLKKASDYLRKEIRKAFYLMVYTLQFNIKKCVQHWLTD